MMNGPRVKVDANTLRRWFNEADMAGKAQRGELRQRLRVDEVRPTLSKDEPPGTRCQLVEYFDGEERIAIVFQYLRPNGELGGSGRPDPKLIVKDGVEYTL
jgi:hypothetical protein